MEKLKQIIRDQSMKTRILFLIILLLGAFSIYQGISHSSLYTNTTKEKSKLNSKISNLEKENDNLTTELKTEQETSSKYQVLQEAINAIRLAEKNVSRSRYETALNLLDSLDDDYIKEILSDRLKTLEPKVIEKEKVDKAEKEKKDAEEAKKKEEDEKKAAEVKAANDAKKKAEKEATEQKEKAANESKKTEETKETSESSSVDIQKEVSKPTDEQEKTMIVFTQMDCSDRGYELSFQGFDAWNIETNYIGGINQWIITTKDKNHGRIKAIYEWDGDEDSGALLVYLLVSGNELLNNLN